jgi:SAM-dependent methyltransferase
MPDENTVTAATPVEDQEQYGEYYYRHDCGKAYERNDYWLGYFAKVAERITRDLHPTSVLDAGCAMGFLVEGLRRQGVDAYGIDVSEYAISKVDESVVDYCKVGSLAEPLGRRYDLVTCIEVVEHIEADQAETVIATLCAATDRLLLSTSPDDYAEATHHNVQPPEYWSTLLAREGFFRVTDQDISYLTPWAALYTRREETPVGLVAEYDGPWYRLRREVIEVRRSLLAKQDEAATLTKELERQLEKQVPPPVPEYLLNELERREEEILRLRDELIGRDEELGQMKGQVAVMADQQLRMQNALSRINRRLPGLVTKLSSIRAKLRRR